MGEYQNSIGRTASDLFLATKSLKPNLAVEEKPPASRFCIVDVHKRGRGEGCGDVGDFDWRDRYVLAYLEVESQNDAATSAPPMKAFARWSCLRGPNG
jgi:hypothetical protein